MRQSGFILGLCMLLLSVVVLFLFLIQELVWVEHKAYANLKHQHQRFYILEKAITLLSDQIQQTCILQEKGSFFTQKSLLNNGCKMKIHNTSILYLWKDEGVYPEACLCYQNTITGSHHYLLAVAELENLHEAIIVRFQVPLHNTPCLRPSFCTQPGKTSWMQHHLK